MSLPRIQQDLVEIPLLPVQVQSSSGDFDYEIRLPANAYNKFDLYGKIAISPNKKIYVTAYEQNRPMNKFRFNFSTTYECKFQSRQDRTVRMRSLQTQVPPRFTYTFKMFKKDGFVEFQLNGFEMSFPVPLQKVNNLSQQYFIKFFGVLEMSDIKISYPNPNSVVSTPTSEEAMEMLVRLSEGRETLYLGPRQV